MDDLTTARRMMSLKLTHMGSTFGLLLHDYDLADSWVNYHMQGNEPAEEFEKLINKLHKDFYYFCKNSDRVKELLRYEVKEELKKEYDGYEQTYIEQIKELEAELKEVKEQIAQIEQPAQTIAQDEAKPQPVAIGKAIELSRTELKEIIMLYVKGLNISAISKETKHSREKVRAVLNNKYKHPASKKKILSVINKLLKKNQNPKTIEKLKGLKNKYSQ